MKHILVLPDGREITGGLSEPALMGVKLTRCVSDSGELSFGSVCAAMLECTVLGLEASLAPGSRLTLYTEEAGNRVCQGVFYSQKPEKNGDITGITAYDSVSLLDRDVSDWLTALDRWPYSLLDFVHLVCQECGVAFSQEEIPNGGYPVAKFSAQGITGRQLLQFAAQLSGCFVTAGETGALTFGWYAPAKVAIAPQGGAGTTPYFGGSLRLSEYTVQPVEKVQIKRTEQDVGIQYPQSGENTYCITGNPLATQQGAALEAVVESLFTRLQGITYTPAEVTVDIENAPWAGEIVTLTTAEGTEHTLYIMQTVETAAGATLSCTGSENRDQAAISNRYSYQALSGKVLEIQAQVEGLQAENRDAQGDFSKLSLTVEGLQTQVRAAEGLQESLTTLTQTAEGLTATVQSIAENGVSRVENQFGLTLNGSALEISRQGSGMTNRLDEQGMYVLRLSGTDSETVMLQADAKGVVATDVSVRNYLVVGSFARLEDYTDGQDTRRTACYFVG